MILNNGGTLRVYSALDRQHRYKKYGYGAIAPICINRNQIPPFQVVHSLTDADVNSVVLIRRETNSETEIYAEMVLAGLETITETAYKILKWRASTLLPVGLLEEGVYYLKITNGTLFWYSEDFTMKGNVSDLWKIEWCHGEDFPLPDVGHIDYTEGYRNYLYADTEIGKPSYGYEEEVKRRDGQNLPLQQIRFKSHRFALILPEEVIDALSLIPLHDTVVISKGDVVYEVDEINLDVQWQEQGDLAVVEFEFRTDSVVVVNGRGVAAETECGIDDGACYDFIGGVAYEDVLALIIEDSADYDNHRYTTPGGATISLENGDLVIIEDESTDPSSFSVQLFDSVGYVPQAQAAGTYIYEANTGRYFFQNGPSASDIVTNRIIEIDGAEITFQNVPVGVAAFEALIGADGVELIGVVSPSFAEETYDAGSLPSGTRAVRMVVSTPSCPAVYTSAWLYLEPLAGVACEGDYESDAAALADGVLPGEMYCLTIDNIYGLPVGVVKQLAPFAGYPSSMAALIDLGYNVVFPVSTDNDMGLPGGVLRINVDGLNTYNDDTAAAAGGVAVGEFYIRNYIDAGFPPYLITKRLA